MQKFILNCYKVGGVIVLVIISTIIINLTIVNITYSNLDQKFDELEKVYGVSKGCTTTTAFEILFDKVPVYPAAIINIQVDEDSVTITHRTQTIFAIPIGEYTYTCDRNLL